MARAMPRIVATEDRARRAAEGTFRSGEPDGTNAGVTSAMRSLATLSIAEVRRIPTSRERAEPSSAVT